MEKNYSRPVATILKKMFFKRKFLKISIFSKMVRVASVSPSIHPSVDLWCTFQNTGPTLVCSYCLWGILVGNVEFQLGPEEVPHGLMNKNCYLKCCNNAHAQGNLHVCTLGNLRVCVYFKIWFLPYLKYLLPFPSMSLGLLLKDSDCWPPTFSYIAPYSSPY
jgi:hypothetical protein